MGKKTVYPVVLTPEEEGGYSVHIPDFDNDTQGEDLANALYMAADAIEIVGVSLQDDGIGIPNPSNFEDVFTELGQIKTLVTVDFDEYRRKTEKRIVKKTVSVPSWLNVEAEKAGVNFSAILQEALKTRLGV
jgi:predicted RNase H-like HicB family nuclease